MKFIVNNFYIPPISKRIYENRIDNINYEEMFNQKIDEFDRLTARRKKIKHPRTPRRQPRRT